MLRRLAWWDWTPWFSRGGADVVLSEGPTGASLLKVESRAGGLGGRILAGHWDGRWVRQWAGHWGDGGGGFGRKLAPPLEYFGTFPIPGWDFRGDVPG